MKEQRLLITVEIIRNIRVLNKLPDTTGRISEEKSFQFAAGFIVMQDTPGEFALV
jgi:hypothetical protein